MPRPFYNGLGTRHNAANGVVAAKNGIPKNHRILATQSSQIQFQLNFTSSQVMLVWIWLDWLVKLQTFQSKYNTNEEDGDCE